MTVTVAGAHIESFQGCGELAVLAVGLPACPRMGDVRYVVGPVMGVRVAGSPVEDLQQLRFTATWSVVEEQLALGGWLRTEGQTLPDLLHPVIGGCAEGGVKSVLVALRRAVFQVKAPGDRLWSDGVRGVLPADLRACW